MVEQEKPFKTIEVIDAGTGQLCKVACMSCIRGHRTTSCGIPVCRSKVFWTVKRPGRPSNSCTCRYGGSGHCKCVVAKSACPHKPKKGEKRSGECRCDEQGRYCCLIEREQWDMLLNLQKPTITFFQSREALEAQHQSLAVPMTPVYSIASPPNFSSISSIPSTPAASSDAQSPRTRLAPRFGMMGIGAPQGDHHVTPDVLAWQGYSPQAPQQQAFQTLQYHPSLPPPTVFDEVSPCCRTNETTSQPIHPIIYDSLGAEPSPRTAITPFPTDLPSINPIEQASVEPVFDYNKMTTDYFNYQLPNAICQKCGLNGCTCKHCPPVMQNFVTGSWAQCCARKHARTIDPPIPSSSAQPLLAAMSPTVEDKRGPVQFSPYSQEPLFNTLVDEYNNIGMQHLEPDATLGMSDYVDFNLNGTLDNHLEHMPVDLSDFLMSDMDDQDGGCGCRP